MTTWRYAVSWSKLERALTCPLSLLYTIQKKPHGKPKETYATARGSLTQFAFEMYFNQQINLRSGGRDPKTWEKVANKVVNSPKLKALNPTFPYGKTEDDLKRETTEEIMSGFALMEEIGLTKFSVKAEVKLNGVFRGYRMFAMVDFLREGQSGDFIFDGKGYKAKTADPRQVQYYALNRASSGRTIAGGGLLYWKLGFEPVDLSPAALRKFVEENLEPTRPVFEKLKTGTEFLDPTPSLKSCRWCLWRETCEYSMLKRDAVDQSLPEQVGLK